MRRTIKLLLVAVLSVALLAASAPAAFAAPREEGPDTGNDREPTAAEGEATWKDNEKTCERLWGNAFGTGCAEEFHEYDASGGAADSDTEDQWGHGYGNGSRFV